MTLFGSQPSLIAMAEPGAICFIATVMEPGEIGLTSLLNLQIENLGDLRLVDV